MSAGPHDLPILERELPVDEEPRTFLSPDGLAFEEGEALEDFDDERSGFEADAC